MNTKERIEALEKELNEIKIRDNGYIPSDEVYELQLLKEVQKEIDQLNFLLEGYRNGTIINGEQLTHNYDKLRNIAIEYQIENNKLKEAIKNFLRFEREWNLFEDYEQYMEIIELRKVGEPKHGN